MSEAVAFELKDNIAVMTLQNGKVNAISHEVIEALHEGLDKAEDAKAVVVLRGRDGIFSGGYDLKTMQAGMKQAMALVTAGSKLARRMLAHPAPIISACGGHAVAKGAFLLLCSDYRIGVQGDFKLGLNEVAIGMIMHHAGVAMAEFRMPPNYFNRSVINAEMFDPETAVAAGFLDRLVAPEELESATMQAAQAMAQLDMRAHHGTKLKARAHTLEIMDRAIELDANSSL